MLVQNRLQARQIHTVIGQGKLVSIVTRRDGKKCHVAKERRGSKLKMMPLNWKRNDVWIFCGHGRGKKKKWGREESPTIRVDTCMKNTRYAPSNSHNMSRFSSISVSSDIILIASSISRKVSFFSLNSACELVKGNFRLFVCFVSRKE